MIEAGQIYFLRKVVNIGEASYGRPCLVLRASKYDATICYFSTKMQYRKLNEVAIESTDLDFKATGLRDSSYILDRPTHEVKLEFFKDENTFGPCDRRIQKARRKVVRHGAEVARK